MSETNKKGISFIKSKSSENNSGYKTPNFIRQRTFGQGKKGFSQKFNTATFKTQHKG